MADLAPSLGAYVASLRSPREAVRDREAFLQRCAAKDEAPTLAGRPVVGLGGSCGKPAFALPFTVRFDAARLDGLEEVAAAFDCFVEYGAYPHLKLVEDGQEIAAVQDWSVGTFVFLRPGYARKEELLERIEDALR